jgi:hypothetical protein
VVSLPSRFADAAKALLGLSAYTGAVKANGLALDDDSVTRIRESMGGSLQPLTITPTRWYLSDLERASQQADVGHMMVIGQLAVAMQADGMIKGLTQTRTSGLVSLPKRYRGRQDIIEALSAETTTRSVFDEMMPPHELARMAADEMICGICVGVLDPVIGRSYPVLQRLDPRFLQYRDSEGRWYYQSKAGSLPITPGDGRWVLSPTSYSPWQHGLWPSLGSAFIYKYHAKNSRGNFSSKLANPARMAYAPSAATEEQRLGFLASVIRWSINSVFEMPPGWDVKILESNGRGWEVFGKEIDTSDLEIMIALAGQTVTTDGGAGFSNADIHQLIRADLIKQTADSLAHMVNTQILPPWVWSAFGEDALAETARVEWVTAPMGDRKVEAETLSAAGDAIDKCRAVLAKAGIKLDVTEMIQRFGMPTTVGTPAPGDSELLGPGPKPDAPPKAPEGDDK